MRQQWTDDAIERQLRAVSQRWCMGRMPTVGQMRKQGGNALACAVMRRGGLRVWRDRLGLEPQRWHASAMGWGAEREAAQMLQALGAEVVMRDTIKCPWDLLVNDVKVDVKAARPGWHSNGEQWTWRIDRSAHAVNFYMLVARRATGDVWLVIPSQHVPLTCMTARESAFGGRLAQWRNRLDLLVQR